MACIDNHVDGIFHIASRTVTEDQAAAADGVVALGDKAKAFFEESHVTLNAYRPAAQGDEMGPWPDATEEDLEHMRRMDGIKEQDLIFPEATVPTTLEGHPYIDDRKAD